MAVRQGKVFSDVEVKDLQTLAMDRALKPGEGGLREERATKGGFAGFGHASLLFGEEGG